ncbi:MAG: Gfo/Idh/MocA family oxidoreductase, partial [Betaproteobacteria bacterium]
GHMHRGAAEFDGVFEVVAGVFSSDAARSREKGAQLGIAAGRAYGTVEELCAAERARSDPIDAVAIMTPNDTHYSASAAALDAGFDVICDKPVTMTLAEAQDLARRVQAGNRVFCITHGYAAYPMTRYARKAVADGTLGRLRLVQVEYIQSGLATKIEEGPRNNRLNWMFDPQRSGLALVMSAIGCHAQHLACFAAGSNISEVSADSTSLLPGREVIDYTSAHMKFASGARGTFTVTQAAAGGENDIRLRVYGENGMLDWSHRSAGYLRLQMQGEPAREIGRGDAFLSPDIIALGRTPRGHPEGLREAFANLYRETGEDIIARNLGRPRSNAPYARIEDGVHTMAFIEACLASTANNGQWTKVTA